MYRLLVASPIGLYPEVPIEPVLECIDYLKCEEAEAFASIDPEDLAACDGVVVPGGLPDLSPVYYGETNTGCDVVDEELDKTQMAMIQKAVELKKPLLGICRGHQMIAVHFGASMIQRLTTSDTHAYTTDLEKAREHLAYCVPGSMMHRAYGDTCVTNSLHHQALRSVPEELKVTQFHCADPEKSAQILSDLQSGKQITGTDEVVIEAVEHSSYPFLGVQWHPELGGNFGCTQVDRFRVRDTFLSMVKECSKR